MKKYKKKGFISTNYIIFTAKPPEFLQEIRIFEISFSTRFAYEILLLYLKIYLFSRKVKSRYFLAMNNELSEHIIFLIEIRHDLKFEKQPLTRVFIQHTMLFVQ